MSRGLEEYWRRRFQARGAQRDDDAGIAGWSQSGLQTRVRAFLRLWRARPHRGGRWLDVGCGAGTYARILSADGFTVHGLDYSLPSLRKAQLRSPPGLDWVAADARRLPIADAAADGVLCFGVAQALSDSRTVLGELRRVTRSGGEVWFDGLNRWCLPNLVGEGWRRLRRRPPHLRYQSPWRAAAEARDCGLVVEGLYWLPVLPGRLQRLQQLVEAAGVSRLLQAFPPLGAVLSHAFVVRARVP